MNDHGKTSDILCLPNSSGPVEDEWGVSWGEEVIDDEDANDQRKKPYGSFFMNGTKYRKNDTVYLRSKDGPPYVGRIAKLYENVKDKAKQMNVRWFCRPCELPDGILDVDYSNNCKEVFVMWGTGAKNIMKPGCVLRHCSVVCTADEWWNSNIPSIEEIAAADHIFDRAFDMTTRTLRPLEDIVKKYGAHIVTGIREPGRAPSRERAARASSDCQPRPLATRASSDLPSLSVDAELWILPALVTSPDTTPVPLQGGGGIKEGSVPRASVPAVKPISQKSKEAKSAHLKVAEQGTAPQPANHGSKRALEKPTTSPAGTAGSERKRQRVDSSLPQQQGQKWPVAGTGLNSPRVGEARATSPSKCSTIAPHGTLNVSSKQKSSEVKKRPREESLGIRTEAKKRPREEPIDIRTEVKKRPREESIDIAKAKGKLKNPKIYGVPLSRLSLKVRDNVSPSGATGPMSGELKSPRVDVLTEEASKVRASVSPSGATGPKGGELKSPRVDVLTKEASKVRVSVSPSGATNSNGGELKSPSFAAGQPYENSSGCQQAQGPEAHELSTDKNQHGRVSSLSAGERQSFGTVSEEKLSNLNSIGNPIPVSPRRSVKVDNHDTRLPHPKVVLSDVTAEEMHSASMQSSEEVVRDGIAAVSRHAAPEKGNKDLSPFDQSGDQDGVDQMCTDFEQDSKPPVKSSAAGLEKGCARVMGYVQGVSGILLKGRKLPASDQGKVPADGIAPPTSKTSNVSKENLSGKSLVNTAAKRAISPSKDPRPSTKRLTEAEIINSKSKDTKSATQKIKNGAHQSSEELKLQRIGVVPKNIPTKSAKKQFDKTWSDDKPRSGPQQLDDKVVETESKLHRMNETVIAVQNVDHASAVNITIAPHDSMKKVFEPKVKIFKFPWQEHLRIALQQQKALLLQNLDPLFSSCEIQDMLEELLQVNCSVRMLPPRNFTCYTSGQALVLFRSQTIAVEVLNKLTENWLIWSKDERPVLARMADPRMSVNSLIHGFYGQELFGSQALVNPSVGQKNAVATSHCSQPNTVEYEMGIQWRLLQDRHTEAWTIAAKDQKAEIDRISNKSWQGKP